MAIQFGGSSTDRIDLPVIPQFNLGTHVTQWAIGCWVRRSSSANTWRVIFGVRNTEGWNIGSSFSNSRMQTFALSDGTNYTRESPNNSLTLNEWTCWWCTFDSSIGNSSSTRIYKGTRTSPMAEQTYTTNVGSGNYQFESGVGAVIGNNAANSLTWVGQLGPIIAVAGKIPTINEMISWQFNPQPMLGAVGFWDLTETVDKVIQDRSGNGNHGTVVGAVNTNNHPPLARYGRRASC